MNKSKLFRIAHSIKNQFNSFADALKKAWVIIKLRASMKKKIVSFKFKKVDGSIREAKGTLNIEYQRKTDKVPNYSVMNYFDVEVNGWRSFKVENLIY